MDAHHIVHWADGGDTTLDNLTLLCRRHHRYLHEYGYQLERAGRELRFLRPDGQHVPDVPRPPGCAEDIGCEALHAAHAAIDATTAVGAWNGERARYDGLVALLQDRSGVKPRATLHVKRTEEEAYWDAENEMIEREQRETTERTRLMLEAARLGCRL